VGVDALLRRLKKRPEGLIVGGNIGKNKTTPNDHAIHDYVKCFIALYDHVDYIVINVSSPNTPGLRDLQTKDFLAELFVSLTTLRSAKKIQKPMFLKIAPDLTVEALDEIIATLKSTKIDGVIATNTTISRENLHTPKDVLAKIGDGGLSGKPLKDKSDGIVHYLRSTMGEDYPIIGVGGIASTADMEYKLQEGANIAQVYTGFIYQGPWMVKNWAAV
jgi:dihydroorotate dehydrogenase